MQHWGMADDVRRTREYSAGVYLSAEEKRRLDELARHGACSRGAVLRRLLNREYEATEPFLGQGDG